MFEPERIYDLYGLQDLLFIYEKSCRCTGHGAGNFLQNAP